MFLHQGRACTRRGTISGLKAAGSPGFPVDSTWARRWLDKRTAGIGEDCSTVSLWTAFQQATGHPRLQETPNVKADVQTASLKSMMATLKERWGQHVCMCVRMCVCARACGCECVFHTLEFWKRVGGPGWKDRGGLSVQRTLPSLTWPEFSPSSFINPVKYVKWKFFPKRYCLF